MPVIETSWVDEDSTFEEWCRHVEIMVRNAVTITRHQMEEEKERRQKWLMWTRFKS
jgi:hypothetical protein